MNQFCLPRLIGHRGAKGLKPENTLGSFQFAIEKGITCIETDVKLSKDGILVLMHDDTLERTTNGTGSLATKDLNYLRSLDAGSWFTSHPSEEKIPTLEESLKLFKKYNISANLELKPCPGREKETAQIFAEFIKYNEHLNIPMLVSSFHFPSLKEVRKILNNIPIGLLFDETLPNFWKEYAQEIQAKTIHLNNKFISKNQIDEIKENKMEVLVYTVNKKERAIELFSYGISSIFTDYPELLS